uniref:Family with sequence similarity 120 member C n=1 Tax=Latimeria chalumnae TaxID=7897 RepID=H3B1L1_LATCH
GNFVSTSVKCSLMSMSEHSISTLLLQVRAHQLVLPPCDVVIKVVSEYVGGLKDCNNLDAIAKDVFKHSQSRAEDKIERFKRAVEYYSAATRPRPLLMGPSPVLKRVSTPHPLFQPGLIAPPPPMYDMAVYGVGETPIAVCVAVPGLGPNQFVPALPPNQMGSIATGKPMSSITVEKKGRPIGEWPVSFDPTLSKFPNHLTSKTSPSSGPGSSPSSSSDGEEPNGASSNFISGGTAISLTKTGQQKEPNFTELREDHGTVKGSSGWSHPGAGDSPGNQGNVGARIPSLLSMATRNHMDITTPPLPQVAPEVLRVAEHRHRRGLMYPYIYHVLTKGEIKIPVCIEDECNGELPPATLLFRAARQYVYGVLFSLAETQRKLERLALRKRIPVEAHPLIIKEWSAYKGKSPQTPELVSALPFREWTCPNLKKLWLGKAVEDKNRRMRAFLACMKSDTPSMLNPANVPTHLLLMCCVLRYMMQWPGGRILHRHELDAFLVQAVSSQLYEPDQLQELKIEKLDARGIQLAALFMSGVDTALFANDSCGQPIPWEHCCPWIYFDGKLFQSKLIKANREKVPLIELCDGQTEQAAKVEKMRQSILEGINLSRQPPPPPLPSHHFVPPMVPPFYPVPLYPRTIGSVPPPPQCRGRGFTVLCTFVTGLGLEVSSSVYLNYNLNPSSVPGTAFDALSTFPSVSVDQSSGLQSIPPQGGKLEIAGMVVGQWAGSKPSRGRGSFGMQVVSVGGPGKG